jgi:hypothetical protein
MHWRCRGASNCGSNEVCPAPDEHVCTPSRTKPPASRSLPRTREPSAPAFSAIWRIRDPFADMTDDGHTSEMTVEQSAVPWPVFRIAPGHIPFHSTIRRRHNQPRRVACQSTPIRTEHSGGMGTRVHSQNTDRHSFSRDRPQCRHPRTERNRRRKPWRRRMAPVVFGGAEDFIAMNVEVSLTRVTIQTRA